MLSSPKSGTRCALITTMLLRCCFVGVRLSPRRWECIYGCIKSALSASLNCALTGGAARNSAGDVTAEEHAAAGGEQLAQRKTSQPGEVRTHARRHCDFPHSPQPADVCVVLNQEDGGRGGGNRDVVSSSVFERGNCPACAAAAGGEDTRV